MFLLLWYAFVRSVQVYLECSCALLAPLIGVSECSFHHTWRAVAVCVCTERLSTLPRIIFFLEERA